MVDKLKLGRPALSGERYPCGKKRPGRYHSDTQVRRLVDLIDSAREVTEYARLGTEAGKMAFQGYISARQLSTIEYVGEVYGRFDAYSGRRRNVKSPTYEIGLRGGSSEDHGNGPREEFHWLQGILKIFPREARDKLEQLCVDNFNVPLNALPDILVLVDVIEEERDRRREGGTVVTLQPRLTRDERIASGAFVWRAEGVSGPGSAKGSEAKIVDMLTRQERGREPVA